MLSAVFILVVVAALGGYIAVISSQQHTASALDVQGVRVYAAARSGLEWGLYQVNVVNAHGTCTSASGSFSPTAPTLLGYTVTVSCTATTDSNGGPTVFVLTAVACNQPVSGACPNTTAPGVNYVERRIDVTF
jgi:MSHA biogenesis protein MshP